jgi:hypothetical protein
MPNFQMRMTGAGVILYVQEALSAAQDSQHRHQQEIPGRDANATPHPDIRDRLGLANQVEIGCGRGALKHRENAIPPASTHAERRN